MGYLVDINKVIEATWLDGEERTHFVKAMEEVRDQIRELEPEAAVRVSKESVTKGDVLLDLFKDDIANGRVSINPNGEGLMVLIGPGAWQSQYKAITTSEEMYNQVKDEYDHYDVELNSLFFDFPVRMKKADILTTYASLQHDINGDDVLRIENGKEQDELIPNNPEFDEVYEGNCKDFLESFNGSERFCRFNCEEQLDFIF